MNNIMEQLFLIVIIFGILILIAYIVCGIYLNKLNKLLYGNTTAMAWIPGFNIYLLGKLTFNKIVGWILIGCMFLQSTTTTTINGVSKTTSFLPENIRNVFSRIYGIVCGLLIIYAIVKYYMLKDKFNTKVVETTDNINTMNNQSINPNINVKTQNLNVSNNTTSLTNNIINESKERKEEIVTIANTKPINNTIETPTWDFVPEVQSSSNKEIQNNNSNLSNNNEQKGIEIIDDNSNS